MSGFGIAILDEKSRPKPVIGLGEAVEVAVWKRPPLPSTSESARYAAANRSQATVVRAMMLCCGLTPVFVGKTLASIT